MSIGPHDLGGQRGFGPVATDTAGEPAYPEGWEGRVIGALLAAMGGGLFNVDQFRAGIEALPPLAYIRAPYYEKWQHTLERNLVRGGVLTEDELAARQQEIAEGRAPDVRHDDPASREFLETMIAQGGPIERELDRPPAFGIGDRVRTASISIERNGEQHTRVPGYVQDKVGTIERIYPAECLPDVHAERGEERPEYVYAVRFDAAHLWDDAEPGVSVSADLWESYLTREDGP